VISCKILLSNMIRATRYGWPNTYVFTKAMGEMIVGSTKGNMNVVIVRPTIITSTYREPFPGWIEGLRYIIYIWFQYVPFCFFFPRRWYKEMETHSNTNFLIWWGVSLQNHRQLDCCLW